MISSTNTWVLSYMLAFLVMTLSFNSSAVIQRKMWFLLKTKQNMFLISTGRDGEKKVKQEDCHNTLNTEEAFG